MNFRGHFLLALIVTAISWTGLDVRPVGAAQDFPPDSAVQAIIEERVDGGFSTGIVLGLLRSDGSRVVFAYGDPGPDALPLADSSVFEIGSITKAFTGVLLADMVERGEVALDDPVSKYLPDDVTMPTRDGREITLLDLATHHSALPRLPTNLAPADASNPYADYTTERLYAFLSGYELPRDIGEAYEYSNLATGLLGFVLARAAGMDYEELVHERILEPLGMGMSGIALTPAMERWAVDGHGLDGTVVPYWDIPTLAGAGGLRSDVDDMLSFIEANIGEPTNDLERAMRASHQPRESAGSNMLVGLNWHILSAGEQQIVWHNGGTGGFRTFAGFDPAAGTGVVVLTNSATSADDIGFHLLTESVPLSPPTIPGADRIEVEVSREILAEYVGVYRLGPDFTVTVTLEDEGLAVQATSQPKFPIFAESETEFFLKVVDAQVEFQRDPDGTVAHMMLYQGGGQVRGPKIE